MSACILKRREKYLSDLRFILMRTLKHQVKLFAKSPQWLPTMCPKARLIPNPDIHGPARRQGSGMLLPLCSTQKCILSYPQPPLTKPSQWWAKPTLEQGQEATVRTEHGTTDWFQIGKGVHQSCILSSCLFNL